MNATVAVDTNADDADADADEEEEEGEGTKGKRKKSTTGSSYYDPHYLQLCYLDHERERLVAVWWKSPIC